MKLIISFLTSLFLLLPLPWAAAATGETLESQIDHLEVHRSPSPNAPVVMCLERGRKLKELRRSGDWIKVIIYGTTGLDGWVRATEAGLSDPDSRKGDRDVNNDGRQPQAASETTDPDFILLITGASQHFKAVCIVINRRGSKKRISIEGHGPGSYGLDGAAANCRVDRMDQHAGTLLVEMYARTSSLPLGSNLTNEAFGCVHVRSNGPWGKADGRRCSRVIRRF